MKQLQTWEKDISELEKFYSSITIPTHPIKLNNFTTITDCQIFIQNHLSVVKNNNGKKTFLPYINRLKELKQFLEKK